MNGQYCSACCFRKKACKNTKRKGEENEGKNRVNRFTETEQLKNVCDMPLSHLSVKHNRLMDTIKINGKRALYLCQN